MSAPDIPNRPVFLSWPKPVNLKADPANGVYEFDLWQGNRCAICGASPSAREARRLAMDHDHTNGLVRGRLCTGCNVREHHQNHRVYQMWSSGMNPCWMFGWYYQFQRAPWPALRIEPEDLGDHLRNVYTRRALLQAGHEEHRLGRARDD
jgi:hypothetical protein